MSSDVSDVAATSSSDTPVHTFPLVHQDTDQSRFCFDLFNRYLECRAKHGEDHPLCQNLLHGAHSMCPTSWLQEFEEKRREGVWRDPVPYQPHELPLPCIQETEVEETTTVETVPAIDTEATDPPIDKGGGIHHVGEGKNPVREETEKTPSIAAAVSSTAQQLINSLTEKLRRLETNDNPPQPPSLSSSSSKPRSADADKPNPVSAAASSIKNKLQGAGEAVRDTFTSSLSSSTQPAQNDRAPPTSNPVRRLWDIVFDSPEKAVTSDQQAAAAVAAKDEPVVLSVVAPVPVDLPAPVPLPVPVPAPVEIPVPILVPVPVPVANETQEPVMTTSESNPAVDALLDAVTIESNLLSLHLCALRDEVEHEREMAHRLPANEEVHIGPLRTDIQQQMPQTTSAAITSKSTAQ